MGCNCAKKKSAAFKSVVKKTAPAIAKRNVLNRRLVRRQVK